MQHCASHLQLRHNARGVDGQVHLRLGCRHHGIAGARAVGRHAGLQPERGCGSEVAGGRRRWRRGPGGAASPMARPGRTIGGLPRLVGCAAPAAAACSEFRRPACRLRRLRRRPARCGARPGYPEPISATEGPQPSGGAPPAAFVAAVGAGGLCSELSRQQTPGCATQRPSLPHRCTGGAPCRPWSLRSALQGHLGGPITPASQH